MCVTLVIICLLSVLINVTMDLLSEINDWIGLDGQYCGL